MSGLTKASDLPLHPALSHLTTSPAVSLGPSFSLSYSFLQRIHRELANEPWASTILESGSPVRRSSVSIFCVKTLVLIVNVNAAIQRIKVREICSPRQNPFLIPHPVPKMCPAGSDLLPHLRIGMKFLRKSEERFGLALEVIDLEDGLGIGKAVLGEIGI